MSVVGTLGGMGTLPNPNAMNPLLQQFIQMQMLQQQQQQRQQAGGFMPIQAQQQQMQSAAPNAPAQPNSAAPQMPGVQTPPQPQSQAGGPLGFNAAPQIPQMQTGATPQRQPAAGDKSLRVDEEGTQGDHHSGGLFGMFDGLSQRMSTEDESGHTPMDQLSLAASLISAGQPSWNINRDPGGDVAQAFANYADRGEARLERANARREHKDELAWQGEARTQQRDEWRRAQAERERLQQTFQTLTGDQSPLSAEDRQVLQALGPDHFIEFASQRLGTPAHRQVIEGGYIIDVDRNGNQRIVGEAPLTAAQRAENAVRWGAINHGGDVAPLPPTAMSNARSAYASMVRSNGQIRMVENMLSHMTDAQLAAQVGNEASGFSSALTQLQMSLKDQYQLGALAGPDQALLRAVTGDPRDFATFVAHGGIRGMRQNLSQLRSNMSLSENAWRTQFAPWGNTQQLSDLYNTPRFADQQALASIPNPSGHYITPSGAVYNYNPATQGFEYLRTDAPQPQLSARNRRSPPVGTTMNERPPASSVEPGTVITDGAHHYRSDGHNWISVD